jgi:glycosyltransferase involved in cell wall biosynthesis
LESLLNQTLDKQFFEVLVIDNNSSDNTQSIVEIMSRFDFTFRYIKEEHRGHSHARNRGWQEAKGKYVAFIDDDAKASPEWARRILDVFENVRPEPVAVGGQIRPWYEQPPPDWFADDFELRSWGKEAHFLEPILAVNGFSGANMAFKRSLFESYGGFSLDFGIVGRRLVMGEETELFHRIYAREPLFWYDPQIVVSHWTPERNFRISYRFYRYYKYGASAARLQQRKLVSLKQLRRLLSVVMFCLKIPIRILITRENKHTCFIRVIQELGTRLGLLFEKT